MKYKNKIKKFKLYFAYNFSSGPWGGGNQFLRFLHDFFKKKNITVNNVNKSNIIIFNSHHNLKDVLMLKLKYKNKYFVHRIDGPLSSYRKIDGKILDNLIFKFNKYIADYTVFLSEWSKKESFRNGFKITNKFKVIHNQANTKYFFFKKKNKKTKIKKIKLIYYSWSNNESKGFDYLNYLDKKLNFDKYEFSFIGNTKLKFKNIKIYKPVNNQRLCNLIHNHDLFLFCSKIESCSNTLLEAMSCGIPLLVRNSSSNPEIFNNYSYLFKSKTELLDKIRKFNFKKYKKKKIQNKSFKEYEKVFIYFNNTALKPKKINLFLYMYLSFYLLMTLIKSKVFNIIKVQN